MENAVNGKKYYDCVIRTRQGDWRLKGWYSYEEYKDLKESLMEA